jgi:hypothetical protein
MRLATVTVVLALLAAACSRSSSNPPPAAPEPAAPDAGSERRPMTAAACEKEGGKVVGDIGDGAIHRPDYRCPDSGQPPIGSIVAEPGGPTAIEGAVCCK